MHPTIFVIIGITGDLASRKLLPALLALYSKKLLPNRFAIVGFSRRMFSREDFREFIRERLNVKPGEFKEEDIKHFLDHIVYEQGYFDTLPAYERLRERLEAIDDRWGQCSNKLFHLSVPPQLYQGILTFLSRSKLTIPCDDKTGWTRVLIEKPFGSDFEMAKSLDSLLGSLFHESQIFRIDHYLAKEALQNILAFRFTNPIFEPMWNRQFIDKVHIKLFENNGVEGRGSFYDKIGALRDVGQNHMLQMLSIIAMDKPKSFSSKDIRSKRAAIMKSLENANAKVMKMAARGQYIGYTDESGATPLSQTETYFRVVAKLNTSRWKGVPFYLESGKCLSDSKTEIDIYFKESKKWGILHEENKDALSPNILTFRIQPEECIKIRFFVKTPGHGFQVEPKTLKFKYADVPTFSNMPSDYEKLIHDAFEGDQTLFASTDEIMASWKYIASVHDRWNMVPLIKYEKGSKEIG